MGKLFERLCISTEWEDGVAHLSQCPTRQPEAFAGHDRYTRPSADSGCDMLHAEHTVQVKRVADVAHKGDRPPGSPAHRITETQRGNRD